MHKEIDNKKVGHKIKSIRSRLGMNMEEFGKMFNPIANKSLISKWENGKSLPNSERIAKIAEIGNISINYLLYDVKEIEDLTDEEKEILLNSLNKISRDYRNMRGDYIQSTIDYFDDFDFSDMTDNEIIALRRLLVFINNSTSESLGSLSHLLQLINLATNENKLNSDSFKRQYKQTVDNLLNTLLD